MATLAGQRAQFTWALNQYNLAEDADRQAYYAKRMAKYIAAAPTNGFTIEQVTQGQLYPVGEVAQYLPTADVDADAGISETEALNEIAEAVDTSEVLRLGEGPKTVYAYGYRCAPDRLKIGLTEGDAVQRIAAQISTGTPDKPVLLLDIKTHDCGALERAIHATLEYRGCRIFGGGKEWFKTTKEELIAIYKAVAAKTN
jgi:T5orf172 domain